jgi:hypothetical protein
MEEVSGGAAVAFLLALVSGAAVLALTSERWRTTTVAYSFVALVFLDLLLFAGSHNNGTVNPAEYFGRSRRLVDSIRKEQEAELFRVNTRTHLGMVMDRNQGMVDRIFQMEGFTPLVLQHYQPPARTAEQLLDLMNAKYRTVADTIRGTLAIVLHPTYFPRAFFLYRTLILEEDEARERFMRSPEFDHRTTAIIDRPLHVSLAQPDSTPGWSARFSRYGNNSMALDVRTDRDGLLVLSEIWYPGWTATLDGKDTPVYRTDHSLRGIVVPAGSHAVEVTFSPDSLKRGAVITGGALGLCFTLIAVSLAVGRRPRSASPTDIEPT